MGGPEVLTNHSLSNRNGEVRYGGMVSGRNWEEKKEGPDKGEGKRRAGRQKGRRKTDKLKGMEGLRRFCYRRECRVLKPETYETVQTYTRQTVDFPWRRYQNRERREKSSNKKSVKGNVKRICKLLDRIKMIIQWY